jgi:hypothetical protein
MIFIKTLVMQNAMTKSSGFEKMRETIKLGGATNPEGSSGFHAANS